MINEEREEYYIPSNYNHSGRYLWGLTTGRNLLEMVIVLVPTVLIVYPLISTLPTRARVIILLLVIFGLGAPLAIGIDGGSIGQYLYRIFTFMIANKKFSLERINEPDPKAPEEAAEEGKDAKGTPEKAKKSLKDRMIERSISKLESLRSKKDESEKEESN